MLFATGGIMFYTGRRSSFLLILPNVSRVRLNPIKPKKDLIFGGARQWGLPADYLALLDRIDVDS